MTNNNSLHKEAFFFNTAYITMRNEIECAELFECNHNADSYGSGEASGRMVEILLESYL